MKKYQRITLAIISIFLLIFNSSTILATGTGSSVDLVLPAELNTEILELAVEIDAPTSISGYEIKINYNSDAFEYVSTSFTPNSSLSTDASIANGILTLSASSSAAAISSGNSEVAVVSLRAIENGYASLAITDSSFTDLYGNSIPASRLKFFSININVESQASSSSTTTTTTTESTTVEDTTEGNTEDEGTSEVTTIEETDTTTTTIEETEETTTDNEESQETDASSSSSTEDTSMSTSSTNSTEEDGSRDSGETVLYVVMVALAIAVVSLLVYLITMVRKRKNK